MIHTISRFKKLALTGLMVSLIATGVTFQTLSMPNTNLFNPYDILLRPRVPPGAIFTFQVGYEGSLKTRGFQADDYEKHDGWRKRVNVLQLFQNEQNVTAAVRGIDHHDLVDDFIPFMHSHQDHGMPRCIIPRAHLKVDANVLLSAQYFVNDEISLGLYLPVYSMRLERVRWRNAQRHNFFDDMPLDEVLTKLEKIGNFNLRDGWRRTGVGDLAALFWWVRDYPQIKPRLKNVEVGLRLGLIFPTGKRRDEDKLLALPFGDDAGMGFLFGGTLELGVGEYVNIGIDGEFRHLFGNTRERRIRVDPAQTDLLFLTKIPVFREPGFRQHYTIYFELERFAGGLSFTGAYQHTRHGDDKFFLDSDRFEPRIANSAENLDEWTTHDIVFKLSYDFCDDATQWLVFPSFSALYKHGFNGKRAILADTLTAVFSISF